MSSLSDGLNKGTSYCTTLPDSTGFSTVALGHQLFSQIFGCRTGLMIFFLGVLAANILLTDSHLLALAGRLNSMLTFAISLVLFDAICRTVLLREQYK
jgi:hypothetical protein